MGKFKYILKEFNTGDGDVNKGVRTQVVDTNPESNSTEWKVSYGADMGVVIGELNKAMINLKKIQQSHSKDRTFTEFYNAVKSIRNEYRSHIRNEFPDEYDIIKRKKEYMTEDEEIDEMSTSAGVGGYNTPFAFNRNKNAKGTALKYYYRLGYKLAEDTKQPDKKCIKLYHSTISPIGKFRTKGNAGYGIYFAKSVKDSKTFGDITYKATICPNNTLRFDDNEVKGKGFFNMSETFYNKYTSEGYDSLVWYRNGILKEFIVLNPDIIKNFDVYNE